MSAQPINSDHEFARNRLREWGRWHQERLNGYPTQSIIVGFFEPRSFGPRAPIDMPKDIDHTNDIVMKAELIDKLVLISWYVKRHGHREIARQMHLSHQKVGRLLYSAEVYVANELFV